MKSAAPPPIPPINDIPWLTKPKKLKSSKVAEKHGKDQLNITESEANPNSESPPAMSSSASTVVVSAHQCPRCGRTGNNDMNLQFILCDKCTTAVATMKMCPMHGCCDKPGCVCKSWSPHPFETNVNCHCCMGNCVFCNKAMASLLHECPRHYAEGRRLGPHPKHSQMACGCCTGTCELCSAK